MTSCRWLVHEPADGPWNMAVDEVLLRSVRDTRRPALRVYRWGQPTLSIGYFQELADRRGHTTSLECPVVRRRTGGGAIVHDQELTYTLVLSPRDLGLRHHEELYEAAHACWIDSITLFFGQSLKLATAVRRSEPEPFMCFARRSVWDLCLGSEKVVGSAQRKLGPTVMQHGTVLLRQSQAAPEFPGIEELSGRGCDWSELASDWSWRIARRLHLSLFPQSLAESELEQIDYVKTSQFGSVSWTSRR